MACSPDTAMTEIDLAGVLLRVIYEFLKGLKRKKANYPTFDDAVKCQKVLDAVERAAKTRKWEKIK